MKPARDSRLALHRVEIFGSVGHENVELRPATHATKPVSRDEAWDSELFWWELHAGELPQPSIHVISPICGWHDTQEFQTAR